MCGGVFSVVDGGVVDVEIFLCVSEGNLIFVSISNDLIV